MQTKSQQESHNPTLSSGFFTSPQKPPFTMVEPGPLLGRINEYYPCGTPVWAQPKPAKREAQSSRLVKAAISPTAPKTPENTRLHQAQITHRELREWVTEKGMNWDEFHRQGIKAKELEPEHRKRFSGLDPETGEIIMNARQAEGQAGQVKTVVTHREWSGEFRIRTQVDQSSEKPPEQEGDRVTHSLTMGGARKIADSCHFMHLQQGGYKTFLTLTMDDAGRCRVEIKQAEGPAVEVKQDKKGKYQTVIPKEKIEALSWLDEINRKAKIFSDQNSPFTPIEWIGGKPHSSATMQPGDDATYQSIQKEISRFLDSMQKMKTRGWKAEKNYPWGKVTCFEKGITSKNYPWGEVVCKEVEKPVGEQPSKVVGLKTKKVKTKKNKQSGELITCFEPGGYLGDKKITLEREKVGYCWVVENPLNERGQRNPHVHMLLDWRVKYSAFPSWADRLERLWGQGFAHLEKMKDSANAGAYMAKAAGYLSKAQGADDQGPVKGNRYGISSKSRAPDWVCVGNFEAGHMGHLIKDVHDYFTHLYGHVFAKRKRLNEALENTPKDEKKKRKSIGKALAEVREKCNALPAIAGKYQLLIKSREKFNEFMAWASSNQDQKPTEWLPAKDAEEAWDGHAPRPDSNWFKRFKFALGNRKAKRRWDRMNYEPFAEQELSRPEPEKPGLFDWFEYEKWSVAA